MAVGDPPEIPDNLISNLEGQSFAATKAAESTTELGTANKFAAETSDMFGGVLSAVGSKISSVTSLITNHSAAFGVLSAALLGASDKFKNFGESVDTTRLNTFSKQFKDLSDIMEHSPGSQVAKAGLQSVIDMAAKAGNLELVKKMMTSTADVAMNMAKEFLKSADDAMYAQNAMYQMAGATGQLSTIMQGIPGVLTAAGTGLENINKTSAEYTNRMRSIQTATNSTDEAFNKWAGAMSALPGGLKAIMEQSDGTASGMNALQGAIQYATGAGLQESKVMELMAQGMHTYNMSAKDSLQYTARAGEILNTFKDKGLMIDDVNKALKGANDMMKGFVFGPAANAATMTQNMSNAMEQYVGQLTAVGVPGEQAAQMFQNLTERMHGLDTAQRAFLSQQTGGPGGLLGNFQMQKLMRDDPEAAQRKMQDALKKEMGGGSIMTLDNVKTQADAAKLQREIMMMTKGPLATAKNDEDAEAQLEALSKGNKIDYTKDKGKFLGEAEERGKTIEQQQMTKFGQVAMTAQSVQLMAGQTNLDTLQGAFKAKTGKEGGVNGTGAGVAVNKSEMRDYMDSVATRQGSAKENTMKDVSMIGSTALPYLADAFKAKTGKEGGVNGTGAGVAVNKSEMRDYMDSVATRQGSAKENTMKDVSMIGSTALPYLADAGKAMIESFKGGNAADIKQTQATLNEQIAKQRAQIAKEPDDLRKTDTAKLNSYLTSLHQQTDQAPTAGQQVASGSHYTPAGQQVGNAIPKNGQTAPAKDGSSTTSLGRSNSPIPVTLVGSGITVNFTGKCPHCNKEVKSTASADSVAPHATNKYPQG